MYKSNQFRTLFEQVFDQFDTDASGSLSKDEIKYGCNCLGLKAWDIDEFFVGLDENSDGEISLSEFKDNLPSYVFKAMAKKYVRTMCSLSSFLLVYRLSRKTFTLSSAKIKQFNLRTAW